MSPRKSLPIASPPTHPATALKQTGKRAPRRPRKDNSHTELTRNELEQMVFDAAHLRAINARSRSGA